MTGRFFSFVGGGSGTWAIRRQLVLVGDPLPPAMRLDVVAGKAPGKNANWVLRGITSNERYVERTEREQLVGKQQGLGRAEASRAALIPIRKSPAWWALTQDDRRAIFEEQSQHIKIGLKYLPPVARRLHHCRDVSEAEPFDFLTWFEYAPAYEQAFKQLVAELRTSEEWRFVDREVDIRLVREEA